ncbi:MAG: hypothetical protein QOK37_453 [Thermoanaerobaculia bacterium]|jgi:hypothetical protein|nr:hypothetical protein [Thermoanaerobaculia bacterium]
MRRRGFLLVMFLLMQVMLAGLLFGDDVKAGSANGNATITSGTAQASSLTPAPANNAPSSRRRAAPPSKSEPELQVEGTITAASATSITVHDSHGADVVLALTTITVIRKGDATIAAADLKVGDQVHVKATSANNVNTATQVVVQTAEPENNEQEIEGTIKVASATSITVHDSHGADVVIALTATTVIRRGDKTIAAADLKAGDRVHVKATSANNLNTAVQVVVQGGDDQHPLEVEGTITAASTSSITVHEANGADVILMLTVNTIIRKGDTAITAADLRVGDRVEAAAIAQGTVNTALTIHVEVAKAESASLSGTVSAISGSQLTVHTEHGDVTVKTDSSTIIRKQGKTIAVSDIRTGDGVSCSGTVAADSTLLAKQIEVHGH